MIFKPNKIILTAGPSISGKEVKYVNDALKNGWNFHYRDYINRFEKAFAQYVGVKYAWATSSGTGALHSGLMALDVKKGDEVIIPEITFVASANVVKFTGATPVFIDVDRKTWCMDTYEFEKKITKKTKAVMPVHIYGNVCNMKEIRRISKKYNIAIIEDACPSLGAEFNGKKTGSLGDVAAFSFQGAKITVTGEGGMLVTNNKKIYERAVYFGDNAKDSKKVFWNTDVAYMYRMSNLLAALGLAQLERIDFFIKRKREIFERYYDALSDVPGLLMNFEDKNTKSIFWMSSIVLDKDIKISRNNLRKRLKERMIDTRPFFYPVSMFPMFKEENTPNAHHIGHNGINLPSGINLTTQEIDYIAQQIKDILKG